MAMLPLRWLLPWLCRLLGHLLPHRLCRMLDWLLRQYRLLLRHLLLCRLPYALLRLRHLLLRCRLRLRCWLLS